MSETKWQWDGDGNPWEDYNTKEHAPWIVDQAGSPVLTGEIHCRSESEARLLAAAPELYEALDHCETLLMRYEINRVDGDAIADEALTTIRAAMAKARGEA
ncbi:hypothetical protein ACCQ10_09210 [Xanthomonas sp. NCPPB 1325]|uniref:hypothetical protein n=1 Tax=Xanthomonas sp. NCPPB 1325 TaxID=487529 RepID=UPI00355823CB